MWQMEIVRGMKTEREKRERQRERAGGESGIPRVGDRHTSVLSERFESLHVAHTFNNF